MNCNQQIELHKFESGLAYEISILSIKAIPIHFLYPVHEGQTTQNMTPSANIINFYYNYDSF